MKILLDTATFLWVARTPSKLSQRARMLFEHPENDIFLSAISSYEIVVKAMLGRLDLGMAPSVFVRSARESHDIAPLPLDDEAAFAVDRLPAIHRDPFDRLLIAQSIVNEMTLLTPDATIARYPIRVAW